MAVQGRYWKLHEHLCGLQEQEWRTSFSEVEAIVGAELPPSARLYRAWWANDKSRKSSRAWLDAGWETANVDMDAGTLLFRRKRP